MEMRGSQYYKKKGLRLPEITVSGFRQTSGIPISGIPLSGAPDRGL
jgi:hypothetical protein